MRFRAVLAILAFLPVALAAQGRRFPPDSLVNTQFFPHNTPVQQVIGQMRDITGALGVRCQFCHVGQEGQPLDQFDFASDQKPTKLVARQMLRMVAEINKRLDTLPTHDMPAGAPMPAMSGMAGMAHASEHIVVTCRTCHRGVMEPNPLPNLLQDAVVAGGVDSASRAYKALHDRYYGSDAYDFSERALLMTAGRIARGGKPDDALALLSLNDQYYPNSSMTASARGSIQLMKGDTSGAVASYRQALQRDSTNFEARRALQGLGRGQ